MEIPCLQSQWCQWEVGGLSKRQLAEIRQLLRSGGDGSMSDVGLVFFDEWNIVELSCMSCVLDCPASSVLAR